MIGFILFPRINITEIDNDFNMWISEDDPIYQTYERFRQEFGGHRTLLIALKSDRLFTPEALEFIRAITGDIERVETVERGRASLTTAIINSCGYSIMMFSSYKPTVWFGGLLAVTMAVAFLTEVFVVPAVITLMPRLFGAPKCVRLGTAA